MPRKWYKVVKKYPDSLLADYQLGLPRCIPPQREIEACSNGTELILTEKTREVVKVNTGSTLSLQYDPETEKLKVWPEPGYGYEATIRTGGRLSIGGLLVWEHGLRLLPDTSYHFEVGDAFLRYFLGDRVPPFFILLKDKCRPA